MFEGRDGGDVNNAEVLARTDAALLSRVELFQGLKPDVVDAIAARATRRTYEKGAHISAGEGDSAGLCMVATGALSTLAKTVNGTTTNNLTYSYNSNGDRTATQDSITGAGTTYGYDQNDQLTSLTSAGSTSQYTYDGTGLRTSKTVGGVAEGFVWNLAEGLPTIIQDGTTKYVTGVGGLPLEQVSASGNTVYYYQDQLGSTRALLDGTGATAATYAYDAYGNIKSSSGSVSNPFQYAGQYTDSESGLQYLRARYYDSVTGQFLTVDPIVSFTRQAYNYADGNPLNGSDPSGSLCVGTYPLSLTGDNSYTCKIKALVNANAGNGGLWAIPALSPPSMPVAAFCATALPFGTNTPVATPSPLPVLIFDVPPPSTPTPTSTPGPFVGSGGSFVGPQPASTGTPTGPQARATICAGHEETTNGGSTGDENPNEPLQGPRVAVGVSLGVDIYCNFQH